MELDYFIAYFLILFVATITPGPSMLLALNHGVNQGLKKTFYSAVGNLIGNLLLAFVSILGLGAILIASGIIFNVIKWIGIIYLVYLGLKLIFEPVKSKETDEKIKLSNTRKKGKLFLDGFIIAIGNPKGILFFTALFPQFINTESGTVSSFIIIFTTLGVVAFGCYLLYAVFGTRLNKLFQLNSFKKIFNRISGLFLIGCGMALAFSKK